MAKDSDLEPWRGVNKTWACLVLVVSVPPQESPLQIYVILIILSEELFNFHRSSSETWQWVVYTGCNSG